MGNAFTAFAYLLSIVLAAAALGFCLVNAATSIMLAISVTAFLLNLMLIGAIFLTLTDRRINLTGSVIGARSLGIAVGGIVLLIIIGGAIVFSDISPADLPSGGLLALSGIFALWGAFTYRQPELPPVTPQTTLPAAAPLPITEERRGSSTSEKEIIREKQVIIKVRCAYCQTPFDETLDKCPHCGAKR